MGKTANPIFSTSMKTASRKEPKRKMERDHGRMKSLQAADAIVSPFHTCWNPVPSFQRGPVNSARDAGIVTAIRRKERADVGL